ncbi:hypothetical protein ASE22_01990 [Sphingomonas sp. Root720]|nr:hypothetical protein ASE22_01990 [Sphingomonas sp. Root720]
MAGGAMICMTAVDGGIGKDAKNNATASSVSPMPTDGAMRSLCPLHRRVFDRIRIFGSQFI